VKAHGKNLPRQSTNYYEEPKDIEMEDQIEKMSLQADVDSFLYSDIDQFAVDEL